MSSSSPLIASHAALEDLRGRLDGVPAIGLDTEFLRERTYRAELCLLQLTTPQGPVCVDPLALGELELLRGLLAPLVHSRYCTPPVRILRYWRRSSVPWGRCSTPRWPPPWRVTRPK